MKHLKKFKINESLNVTSDIEGHNNGEDTNIADYLPEFYEENKERIDAGRIKFFYDAWATEVGCLIDLDTLEAIIIDTRG